MNDLLQRLVVARLKAGARRVMNEPVLVVAALTAAANGATNQTWQGYGAAALTALVRFFVTGPDGTDIGLSRKTRARRAHKRAAKKAAKKASLHR